MNRFDDKIGGPLLAESIDIVQVNVGLVCNQACVHCHLECSPDRTESMTWETMEHVLRLSEEVRPRLVDVTGGAPELNPNLKRFIRAVRKAGWPVQVRTNLSAMTEEGCRDCPDFFAENRVGLVASLPCYLEENVDKMRGDQSFSKSISVLRHLNELGYGAESGLTLDLVFNPAVGTSLPPGQDMLQQAYTKEMKERYGVVFNRLLTIANVPIGRSLELLKQAGQEGEYMKVLADSFNPATVDGLMCRHQINIGWDGRLYDCDFNQALSLPVSNGTSGYIRDFDVSSLEHRRIVTGNHCLTCTAGAGSSCGGALA